MNLLTVDATLYKLVLYYDGFNGNPIIELLQISSSINYTLL